MTPSAGALDAESPKHIKKKKKTSWSRKVPFFLTHLHHVLHARI